MANTELAKLVVALEAQTAQFNKAMEDSAKRIERLEKRTQRSLGRINSQFAKFGQRMTGLIAGYLGTRLVSAVVRATAEQEKAVAQLDAVLASTGGVAGRSSQQLQELASEMQRVTTYGDEAVIAMQSVLLTFTQVRGNEFDAAVESTLNLATALKMDLQSAALLVGKALNDPVRGATALRRSGIQLTESQTALIKSFVETGRVADAQRIILQELETQFGGSARAARDTFGGALDGVKNAFNDLLEAKSGVPAATEALNNFADALSDPSTKQAADTLLGGIIVLVTEAATKIAWLAGKVKELGEGFAAWRFGPAIDDTARIDEAIANVKHALENQLPLKGGRLVLFGKDGIFKYWSEAELRAELQRLQAMRDFGAGASAAPTAPAAPTGNRNFLAGVDTDVDTSSGSKAGKSAAEAAADAAEKAREAISKQVEALRQQVETFGASDAAIMAYRVTLGDLADDFAAAGPAAEPMRQQLIELAIKMQELEAATEAEQEALAKQNAMQQEAAQLIESLKDEYQVASDTVERYNELRRAGLITEEQLAAAIGKVSEALAEQVNQTKETTEQMSVFWDQAMRNMQDVLADALFTSFEDGLDGMLLAWAQALKRMAAEALAANIFGALTAGAKGVGGWLGGIFGAIFGGVTVGGSGAAAAAGGGGNWVGPRAEGGPMSPGKWYLVGEEGPELMQPRSSSMVLSADTTAALLRGTREHDDTRERAIQITMNIQTPDADSFRRTETQIQARLQTAMQRASARKN